MNFLCFLILIFAPLFCGQVYAQKQDKLARVGVARVQNLSDRASIELPGTVMPWAISRLAAEIDGRVEKIEVREGQFVKKGTPLIYLRTQPLKLELELARAEKNMAATELEKLTTGTRLEVIEAAKAALQNAQASLKLAKKELTRIQKLFEDGILSGNNYDNAKAAVDLAQATYDEKKARLNELEAGPRIEEIRQQEARLSATESKIRLIEDQINRSVIRAPFNGSIVEKQTEVGQWLEKGDPGLTMIVTNPVKVEVHIPQHFFNLVREDIQVQIKLESRQSGVPDRTFKGKVIEIIHLGNPGSRTFPVRIKVDNPKSALTSGMLVKVIYQPEKSSNKNIYVPKDALVRSPRETAVWVIRPESEEGGMKAHKVVVTPGEQIGNLIAVATGKVKIKAGEWVVIQGNERLRPGMGVEIIRKFP